MHLSKKIQFTLDELFASFDLQQIAIIHEYIKETCHRLDLSGHKLLTLMHHKNISYDEFLSNRCLPLIRFYLAPLEIQQHTFLSREKLATLFSGLPTVEAYLFKNAMELALQHRKNIQSSTLSFPHLPNQNESTCLTRELSIAKHQPQSIYSERVYQIQEGNLEVIDNTTSQPQNVLSYADLSPLQQLEAQKICKEKYNLISA